MELLQLVINGDAIDVEVLTSLPADIFVVGFGVADVEVVPPTTLTQT